MLRGAVVAARHRGLSATDAFVASYPRSGNSWIRFVLADVATGEEPDFESVERHIPNVGWHAQAPSLTRDGGRLIKTHEPYRRSYRRAVYLVRDVRDVLISQYRAYRTDPDDLSDFDRFIEAFGTRRGSPYGSWVAHVRSWQRAAGANRGIEIHRFEDLRADPVTMIGAIAERLGLEPSRDAVRSALDRNTSRDMHAKEAANRAFLQQSFGYMSRGVREGAAGRWRDLLSDRHLARLAPELELNQGLGYPSG